MRPGLLLLLLASPDAGRGLVDATKVLPDLVVELRYATADNFLKRAVYPEGARCLLLPEVAEKLAGAAAVLRQKAYRLKAWDCYRPYEVQRKMWELVPRKGFVADPNHGGSMHNRGAAVDVSLVALDGGAVEMPTDFDTFSRHAYLNYAGGSEASLKRRDLLRATMEDAGFKHDFMEWWHYELPDALRHPVLDLGWN